MKATKYIVREREFTQLSKPNPYQRKRALKYTKWNTIGEYDGAKDAMAQRSARNVGLFQRAIFRKGTMVVDERGQVLVGCEQPDHPKPCYCWTKS